jgi:hypothetical protein
LEQSRPRQQLGSCPSPVRSWWLGIRDGRISIDSASSWVIRSATATSANAQTEYGDWFRFATIGDLLRFATWRFACSRVDWSGRWRSSEFARWWWSPLPGAPAVGVLDWQTYQGGTRGRRMSGILPGYSCKEGRRRTPTRIPRVLMQGMSLPSSYRSRRGHIRLPRVLPLVGWRSKTPTIWDKTR